MMVSRIGIIIQARTGSKRLPGKILMPIGGRILLDHILFRLSYLKNSLADIILATTNRDSDDAVEKYCISKQISCFRGSETNVLERYYYCAKRAHFRHIVRLTGDNPFVDIYELDRLIDLHISSNSDYTHSFTSLPIGVGAEIFTFEALERSYSEGHEAHHIEHVNEYMLENPHIFKTSELDVCKSKKRPDINLTVDTKDDYRRACCIVSRAQNDFITTEEAISLCLQFV